MAALIALSCLGAGVAHAAAGDLSFRGCYSTTGGTCATFPSGVTGWSEPQKVVAAPDESSAFGIGTDGVIQFDRASNGTLTFDACLSEDAGIGCQQLPWWARPTNGPQDIAVSPDGRDVYELGYYRDAVAHFRLDAAGHLAYVSCFGPVADGCSPWPAWADTVDQPVALALSPDGREVYLVDWSEADVWALSRDGSSGDLSYLGCYGSSVRNQCSGFPTGSSAPNALPYPTAMAVSPDGSGVYVASGATTGGTIAHFTRAGDGSLNFHDCIDGNSSSQGCSTPASSGAALVGAETLQVSPSGNDIYVGADNDAVDHLRLDSSGDMTLSDCLAENVTGCGKVLGGEGVLHYPRSVVLSGDGQDLYVEGSSALTHLVTGPGGAPSFVSCLSSLSGCQAPPTSLDSHQQITLSPDGSTLYAAANDSLSIFSRGEGSTPAAASPPPPPPPAVELNTAGALGTAQAIVNADINPLGEATTYHVEYGTSSSYGSRLPASDQAVGSDSVLHAVSVRLTGLAPATTYHYRVVATSAAGTSQSPDQTITTTASPAPIASGSVPIGEASASDRSTTIQQDAGHDGYLTGDALAPPLVKRWALSLGDAVSYPVIAEGRVFVIAHHMGATPGVTLYALDASTATVLWSYQLIYGGGGPLPGVTYDNGTVYVEGYGLEGSNRLGGLAAFNAANGEPLWSNYDLWSGCCSAPPTASGGSVFGVGESVGGTLMSVRESDGSTIWRTGLMAGDRSSPTVSADKVYVAHAQTDAFNVSDGSRAWQQGCGGCSSGGLTSVLSGGRLYVRDVYDNTSHIYDAQTGGDLGTFPANPTEDPQPAIAGSTMVLLHGGELSAIDLTTGATNWKFSGDGGLDSAPIVVDDTVYIGSSTGELFALSLSSGQTVWSANAGAPITAPDVWNALVTTGLGAGDGLLVVPASGELVAYSDESRSGSQPPAVATGAAGSLTPSGATLTGTVNPEGTATSYHFDWGTSTSYGSRAPNPDADAGAATATESESQPISDLLPSTTYHYRLVATNSAGASYGQDLTFTTPPAPSPSPPPENAGGSVGPQTSFPAAPGSGSAQSNPLAPPSFPALPGLPQQASLRVAIRVPRAIAPSTLTRHGLTIEVTCSSACVIDADLFPVGSRRDARVWIARSPAVRGPAGAARIPLRLTAHGRHWLRRPTATTLLLALTIRSAGARESIDRRISLVTHSRVPLPPSSGLLGIPLPL